jgi:hypothetical protein
MSPVAVIVMSSAEPLAAGPDDDPEAAAGVLDEAAGPRDGLPNTTAAVAVPAPTTTAAIAPIRIAVRRRPPAPPERRGTGRAGSSGGRGEKPPP